MNAKLSKILTLILLTIHTAFAQAGQCKDETLKAENFYSMCINFDVKSASYMDCIKLFMEQKAKANEACKAAPVAALPPVSLAQKNAKPKIAVYLMGSKLKPNEVEMIETKISIPFIQSGQYTIVERNDPLLSKLAAEVKKQKDWSLDYSKIRSLGKQADIKFVCVANIVEAFGIASVSARLIDTESDEIPKMAETEIKNLSEIGQASAEIYKQISGGKAIAANQNKQNSPDSKCDNEKNKARIIYDRCINMGKTTGGYAACVEDYKNQKYKAEQQCLTSSVQEKIAPPPYPALDPARCIGAKCPSAAAFASVATMSVGQALRESSLPGGCLEDFIYLLEDEDFSMANFIKELPPAVAKVKLQMKSPLPFGIGKPKDDDVTSVGLTVSCIKSLPESPAEIQKLLKDIALKAGLNFK